MPNNNININKNNDTHCKTTRIFKKVIATTTCFTPTAYVCSLLKSLLALANDLALASKLLF